MDQIIKQNLIDSYQEDGGFIIHNGEMLRELYKKFGIDPKSNDRRLIDLEAVSHFFQHGIQSLFKKLEITRDDSVLSLGEGNGAPSRLLAKMVGCRIVGIDINPDQIPLRVHFYLVSPDCRNEGFVRPWYAVHGPCPDRISRHCPSNA